MEQDESQSPSIAIRVVYQDLPDVIQLETRVFAYGWSGVARAYTSPDTLREQADGLAKWSHRPDGELTIEAGADTGIGWLLLRFYPVDMARHPVCHVRLATDSPTEGRPEQVGRLSLEIPTEPGLIERFARELAALAQTLQGEAVLRGVPA